MQALHGVYFGKRIWKVVHLLTHLMNPHAENAIFSEVDVLVFQHALLRVSHHRPKTAIDGLRQHHSAKDVDGSDIGRSYCVFE